MVNEKALLLFLLCRSVKSWQSLLHIKLYWLLSARISCPCLNRILEQRLESHTMLKRLLLKLFRFFLIMPTLESMIFTGALLFKFSGCFVLDLFYDSQCLKILSQWVCFFCLGSKNLCKFLVTSTNQSNKH